MSTRIRTIAVAVNPAAAGGASVHVAPVVVDSLRAAGFEVTVAAATSERALRERLVALVGDGGVEALVVVGGDGLVNLAVDVLAGSAVALGIVPAGTGNDAARELGIPLGSVAAACDHLIAALEREPRRTDVGVITPESGADMPPGASEAEDGTSPPPPRRFLCAVSAGFDALVNERANSLRFPRGPHRYTVALLLELARLRPRRYRLTVDGVAHDVESVLLAVANLGSIGGGMRIVPFASPMDGTLDALVVAPLGRIRFLRLFPRVFAGRHVGLDVVSFHSGSVIRIECDEPIVAYADGERIGPLPVLISVEKGALGVLT
ncbi:diacylglycerol/lipid kinase family protein [Labedella endophytica]|uniref:Diacylglycerol kinase n=1 Tax=Labedella endophytica TaxID=1523160 RepID=A0A433JNF2_9MICO|nr:diacylglycerol kinase family protein [Labedella endophytica]RUQ97609.1 diacylglycerol kinase [Labedella endophytica]